VVKKVLFEAAHPPHHHLDRQSGAVPGGAGLCGQEQRIGDAALLPGCGLQAPLVVLLFIAFVLGAVAGVAASFSYGYRQRREILSLKRRERRSRRGLKQKNKRHNGI